MPNKNRDLEKAKKEKKDEFYTQLADIENELRHYKHHFKDKIVLCNCDDPYESNFLKYFLMNFNTLGLKKVIATSYSGSPVIGEELKLFYDETDEPLRTPYIAEITEMKDFNEDGAIDLNDAVFALTKIPGNIKKLKGNGDFRSKECIELLKESDIVCTNPPFSLFREYVLQLIDYDKKFIIIGNQNAISYKELFPLIQNNKMWLGYGFKGNVGFFESPYEDTATSSQHKEGLIRVSGVMWFTNLDHNKRHEILYPANGMTYAGNEDYYPTYVNYPAIEVGKVADIPKDYTGEMGVPITFLDKYNPEQFDIIGISLEIATPIKEVAEPGITYVKGGNRFYLKDSPTTYKRLYDRIVIKRK